MLLFVASTSPAEIPAELNQRHLKPDGPCTASSHRGNGVLTCPLADQLRPHIWDQDAGNVHEFNQHCQTDQSERSVLSARSSPPVAAHTTAATAPLLQQQAGQAAEQHVEGEVLWLQWYAQQQVAMIEQTTRDLFENWIQAEADLLMGKSELRSPGGCMLCAFDSTQSDLRLWGWCQKKEHGWFLKTIFYF